MEISPGLKHVCYFINKYQSILLNICLQSLKSKMVQNLIPKIIKMCDNICKHFSNDCLLKSDTE